MEQLELHLLGDLEVIRDGVAIDLPPSRKTRALLAWLALNPRAMRREQLCELLWEIPDDPRGSLRWSLSKIRKLVDSEQRQRIIADRSTVSLDVEGLAIDVNQLQELTEGDLQQLSLAQLEAAAHRYSGTFLEGLDLPDFHNFYTWCIAGRERAGRAQAALLKALLARLQGQPGLALPWAGELVALLPFDAPARAGLIELLIQLDRKQEAEQQYRIGLQKLAEIGRPSGGRPSGGRPSGGRPTPDTADSKLLLHALRGQADSSAQRGTAAPVRLDDVARKSLVGREQELQLLRELVSALPQSDRARALLIRGDPGMGKSRLLQAAAALAREIGAGILKAAAFESELIRPFAAWNDALRRALPDNPASALLASGEQVSRDQVFASLSDTLAAASSERPILLLFDDVQWCDESSASAMLYALRMNRRQPILLVGAARENEFGENAAVHKCARALRQEGLLQEIHLGPMSPGELAELIKREAPAVDAERLGRECGGNPLLAMELARAEREGGSGQSLSDLVRDRMSHLDEDAVAVLKWAAVMAPRISISSLEQVTALDRQRLDSAIGAAERQGILHPGERGFRFSHDLIANSIYEDIPTGGRQIMHRRAAELLEVDAALDLELAADLAHHAPKSGDPGLACRAMVSAGRLCLRFYAYPDALELCQRGLQFAAELGDASRVCHTLELTEIRLMAAAPEDWESRVDECIALAEQALDHGELGHARIGYQLASYLRWIHGQTRGAHRDSLQAERVTRSADDSAHVLGMAEAAKCLALLERDLSRADAMAMEAHSLATRQNIQCGALHIAQGILRYHEGRLDAAVEHLEEARTLCKAQGDRFNEFMANEHLTVIEIERGDFPAARERCRSLLEIGSRLREGSEGPFAAALDALCRQGLQSDQEALEDAMDILRREDAKQRLAFILNRAALLDIRERRLQRAATRASEALELATTMERPSELLMARLSLATIARYQGNQDNGEHHVAIRELLATPVARWARDRAASLNLAGE